MFLAAMSSSSSDDVTNAFETFFEAFCIQSALGEKIFDPKIFLTQKLLDPKIFLTQKLFDLKIFLTGNGC